MLSLRPESAVDATPPLAFRTEINGQAVTLVVLATKEWEAIPVQHRPECWPDQEGRGVMVILSDPCSWTLGSLRVVWA